MGSELRQFSANFDVFIFAFPMVATLGPTSQLWPNLTTEPYRHLPTVILSNFGEANCTSVVSPFDDKLTPQLSAEW